MPSIRFAVTAAMLAAVLFTAMPARAEAMTPEATLEALMSPQGLGPEHFGAAFLAALPLPQLQPILAGIRQANGPLEGVDRVGSSFRLRFADATIPTTIALDGEGRIIGLWFGPAEPLGSIESLAAAIHALPGSTALLVVSDGKDVIAQDADRPLAIGSAAKLAVLVALRDAVAAGRLAWDQVVPLAPSWRSLPSGQLQDWPDGTPLTIATLANLMISVSDNTATDALIRLVGRGAVEAVAPANTPFLTTRELFTLKTNENAPLRTAWIEGDAGARRALLAEIADRPLPKITDLSAAATHAVEWFLSAREVCRLLDATAELGSVGINPGVAEREPWKSVAYKGGSELGVLNLSTRVVGHDGRVHCVVASWNHDAALDDQRLIAPYRGILNRLAERE
ncbi:serine hydrolase [Kaistia nematophila]|uniref:Serine hydrolase n=1 Tax=Kaistia nematophila TaxID=2994654 RepID=A0A9X3DZL3_9HYPH|nr:serine hydrolase [Kaistia nematophila]MCX5568755.1 serine hydrolase [Kaistia nematophila]